METPDEEREVLASFIACNAEGITKDSHSFKVEKSAGRRRELLKNIRDRYARGLHALAALENSNPILPDTKENEGVETKIEQVDDSEKSRDENNNAGDDYIDLTLDLEEVSETGTDIKDENEASVADGRGGGVEESVKEDDREESRVPSIATDPHLTSNTNHDPENLLLPKIELALDPEISIGKMNRRQVAFYKELLDLEMHIITNNVVELQKFSEAEAKDITDLFFNKTASPEALRALRSQIEARMIKNVANRGEFLFPQCRKSGQRERST